MQSIRCLVLSDSHGRVDLVNTAIKRAGRFDALFFLGDGLSDLMYATDGDLRFPIYAVKGNCDFGSPLSDRNVYKIDSITLMDKKIVFTHGDLYGVKYGLDGVINLAANTNADIVLFGHTHEPCERYLDGIYYFNPGSLCPDRAPSSAGILTLTEQGVLFSFLEL